MSPINLPELPTDLPEPPTECSEPPTDLPDPQTYLPEPPTNLPEPQTTYVPKAKFPHSKGDEAISLQKMYSQDVLPPQIT